jgi:hypothetical protein
MIASIVQTLALFRRPLRICSVIAALAILGSLAPACSSESDAGEGCDAPGGGDGVCEEGTVCGKPTDKAGYLVCIVICIGDKDCPGGGECKGVDGTSIKGCRFKD